MLKRILLAFVLAASMLPVHALSVREMQLEEIIDGAGVAFQGTVTENRSARDPQSGRIVTFTTFLVQDTLKGKTETTHTIKQLGGVLETENIGYKVDTQTTFSVGKTYVVFLYGKSKMGFSSPVGVMQGSFAVVQDEQGLAVSNGRDFHKMTEQSAANQSVAKMRAKARGDGKKVGLDEFKEMVRARTGVSQ